MGREIQLDLAEESVANVMEAGFGAVDVRTESGIVFRFEPMADGHAFDDGYFPFEDPDYSGPAARNWVFEIDEIPSQVIDALEDAGYEYTGKSSHPRGLMPFLGDDSESDTWRDRAERYADVIVVDEPEAEDEAEPAETATDDEPTEDTDSDTDSRPESPAIGTRFEHAETGEVVEVVEHMFGSDSSPRPHPAEPHTPFTVEPTDGGERVGFPGPESFYEEYEPVDADEVKQ